jgi:hypothetical protein
MDSKIADVRLAFLRLAYDLAPGKPGPEEVELPSGYSKSDIDGASVFLEEYPITEQEQHDYLCDLFKSQRERLRDLERVIDSALAEIHPAFQALPCPQCRQTGWTHKMDCSQGDLERVASHPGVGT